MATYEYPRDNDEYKARVRFTVDLTKPTGSTSAVVDTLRSQITGLENQIVDLEREIDSGQGNTNSKKETKQALQRQVDELKKNIQEFKGQQSTSAKKEQIQVNGESAMLYLPMGLVYNDGVQYENFELGATGAAMEQGIGFAQSMLQGVGSLVANLSGGGGTDLARLAGIQLSSKAGGFADEVRAVQKLSGGLTLNPNERVLFKQPNMRTFTFQFKFVAKSQEEAREIEDIIRFFRTELYPEEISGNIGDATIGLGYRFPNKFRIDLLYDGEDIPGISKIKPCYLQDLNTTYNASQMAMHSDGRVMEVDMAMVFRETSALTRQDVEAGY